MKKMVFVTRDNNDYKITLDTEKDVRIAPHDVDWNNPRTVQVFAHLTKKDGEIHLYEHHTTRFQGEDASINFLSRQDFFSNYSNVTVDGDKRVDEILERLEKSLPAEL